MYWISLVVFGFIFDVFIIVGNFVLFYVIYKDFWNLFCILFGFFVVNLSVVDLLLGLFSVFFVVRDVYCFELIYMFFFGILKVVMFIVFIIILFVSSNIIIVMFVICYVVISSLMEYKVIIIKKRIKIYFVVLWVVFLGICVLFVMSVFEEIYIMIYLYIYVIIFVILLMVIYVKVFCVFVRWICEL